MCTECSRADGFIKRRILDARPLEQKLRLFHYIMDTVVTGLNSRIVADLIWRSIAFLNNERRRILQFLLSIFIPFFAIHTCQEFSLYSLLFFVYIQDPTFETFQSLYPFLIVTKIQLTLFKTGFLFFAIDNLTYLILLFNDKLKALINVACVKVRKHVINFVGTGAEIQIAFLSVPSSVAKAENLFTIHRRTLADSIESDRQVDIELSLVTHTHTRGGIRMLIWEVQYAGSSTVVARDWSPGKFSVCLPWISIFSYHFRRN